tara:strand:- start:9951 stop:10286 length:336 start_codon:yes stop_codon:yes gene_type:complete
MENSQRNPFYGFRERIGVSTNVKGVLQPDLTVEFQNADEKIAVRFKDGLPFEVEGTETNDVIQRSFARLKQWKDLANANGYVTVFDTPAIQAQHLKDLADAIDATKGGNKK